MASFIRQVGLLQIGKQPVLQQTRSKGNVNLYKRKPKTSILHFKKAELFSVLKPHYPEEQKPMWETCGHVLNPRQGEVPLTAYETVYKREMMNRFDHAKFVAVLASNPMLGIHRRRAEVHLGRKQMTLIQYSKRVMKDGLRNSVYANFLQLLDGETFLLFCAEPTVKDMFQITKRHCPQFIVLGGYLEGRLLSRSHLEEYAALPNLEACRVKLLTTINSAAVQLARNIETSQTVLISRLESRAEELRKAQGSDGGAGAAEVSGNKEETSPAEIKDPKS